MNLQARDYDLLAAISRSGGCTRKEVGADKIALDRLRNAGLIRVHIAASPLRVQRGRAGAHRWVATDEGRLLSGTS